MNHHRRFIAAAALLLALAAASPTGAAFIAYDLTGTWSGTVKCKEDVAGVKQKETFTAAMRISQVGVNIGAEVVSASFTNFYGGLANADAKKPDQKGEAIFVRCGTSDQLDTNMVNELARLSASTKPNKVKATLKGFSFFSTGNTATPFHGTCTLKFTRTDKVDPNFDTSCAVSGLQAGGAK